MHTTSFIKNSDKLLKQFTQRKPQLHWYSTCSRVCLSKSYVDLNPNTCSLLEQSFLGLRFAYTLRGPMSQIHIIRFNGLKYTLDQICLRLFTNPLECCAKTTLCMSSPEAGYWDKHYRDKKFDFLMTSNVLTRSPVIWNQNDRQTMFEL